MMNEGVPTTPNPGEKAKQDALFEDREPKKIIRVITVMAYMCSVSFVGVVLSAYYIFLWHPPNPRLMHQQVAHSHQDGHHEARVDYLHQSPDFTHVRAVEPKLTTLLDSLMHTNPGAETLKIRREAVKKTNAILSASFEKVKFTEMSGSTETSNLIKHDNNIDTTSSTFSPTKTTEDSSTTSVPFSSASPEEDEKSSSEASEDSISNNKITTESTLTSTQNSPSSRRTTRPGIKKPHQTPFALKHLEVPIKLEPTKRRPIRFSTTTFRSDSSSIPNSTEGTLSDNLATSVTASSSSSSDSSEIYENASPRHVAKSLYKMLTNPPASSSLRDLDYSSSTDLPQIFPAIPRANSNINNNDNDDYRDNDATITPMDEPNDD